MVGQYVSIYLYLYRLASRRFILLAWSLLRRSMMEFYCFGVAIEHLL